MKKEPAIYGQLERFIAKQRSIKDEPKEAKKEAPKKKEPVKRNLK